MTTDVVDTDDVLQKMELDDTALKDLQDSVSDLVDTLKEETFKKETEKENEKLDELLDFLQEEKEIELEKKEGEIEKLGAIEELLQKEELNEEEQIELDLLLEKQAEIEDLEEQYIKFQVENQQDRIDHLEIISENTILINEKFDLVIAQNEVSNHADTLISIYGTMIIPALLIVYCGNKFFKWFI